jgi:TatD DNase family protein
MHSDAHIHLYDLFNATGELPVPLPGSVVVASSHAEREFEWQESLATAWQGQILLSFGIHPQEPSLGRLPFLERLVSERRIVAIGECGFDLYDDRFRASLDDQLRAWDAELAIARESGLPLVVHCRKALDRVFADAKRLKELSAVVFHGWPGSAREARSLVERGVNAYFSCGKGLLRGDRSLRETAATMSIERILTETDAPWMTLKGESVSAPEDIRAVTAELASIRELGREETEAAVYENFKAVFGYSS